MPSRAPSSAYDQALSPSRDASLSRCPPPRRLRTHSSVAGLPPASRAAHPRSEGIALQKRPPSLPRPSSPVKAAEGGLRLAVFTPPSGKARCRPSASRQPFHSATKPITCQVARRRQFPACRARSPSTVREQGANFTSPHPLCQLSGHPREAARIPRAERLAETQEPIPSSALQLSLLRLVFTLADWSGGAPPRAIQCPRAWEFSITFMTGCRIALCHAPPGGSRT